MLDPGDLLAALGPAPLMGGGAGASSPASAPQPTGDRDQQVLAAVGSGATLEQLSLHLKQPAGELLLHLLSLELAGQLQAEPGLRWRPA